MENICSPFFMKLLKILKTTIMEDDQVHQLITMSPEDFIELMKVVNYNGDLIPKLRDYKNKSIKVVGNLDLSNTPTKSLGNLVEVTGSLSVTRTQIKKLDVVAKWKNYHDTPLWRYEERLRIQKILSDADERRESEEWSLDDTDDRGLAANALFNYLVSGGEVENKTTEDLTRIQYLENELQKNENLEKDYEEEGRDLTDIHANIEVINDELEELNNKIDVYNLIPTGRHYRLYSFNVVGGVISEDKEWAVGNEYDTEETAKEYYESLIDDTGIPQYFEDDEDVMDLDRIEEIIRDHYDYDVRENPESYFDDDDYELSDEQEDAKKRLEAKIVELEQRKEQWEEYQNKLEDEIEEPEDYSEAYDKVQEQIDQIDEEIENTQEVIDDMEPDKEPTDDMIDEKVEDLVSGHMRRSPISFLKDMGYDDLSQFYDVRKVVDELIRIDGYGPISSYNGDYDTQEVNGETFYIFRIN